MNPSQSNVSYLSQKSIGFWLFSVAVLVFAIIIVGGATRLTDSGLSITHWSPIHGAIPPLNATQWAEEFEKYKQIAEYKFENHGMSLNEFKFIFWWEWAHRLLGRVIGLVLLLPLLYFWIRGRLKRGDIFPLASVVLLVGLQGAIGWWMVSSGINSNRVDVAAYRLAAHLGMGFLLLGILVAMAFQRLFGGTTAKSKSKIWSIIVLIAFAQIILGAFTAGTHAGFVHNDWPKIDGNWLPNEYFKFEPLFRNFVENTQAIQFNHRIIGYSLFLLILFERIKARFSIKGVHNRLASLAILLCIAQIILGISLLTIFAHHTPPQIIGVMSGVAHQGLAAILFAILVLAFQTSSAK